MVVSVFLYQTGVVQRNTKLTNEEDYILRFSFIDIKFFEQKALRKCFII